MITYAHDSTIILVSIVVSLVAAFTGLALTNKIGALPVSRRKALIVMSAFVLGGGIWSMHFVAMLAHRFEVPIHYDLLQTLSSALVAILVVGLALLILHFAQRTSRVLTGAGLLLGAGIVLMHFIGMLGMRGVIPMFSTWSIVAAALVAAVMGVMAIRVSYGTRTHKSIVLGGLWFGFSVVFVHFTAMAGTRFRLDPAYEPLSTVLDPESLAIVVTVAAFIICGTFLLAASTFLGVATEVSKSTTVSDPELDPESVPESVPEPVQELTDRIPESTEDARQAQMNVRQAAAEPSAEPSAKPSDERSDELPSESADDVCSAASHESGEALRIPFERNKHIEFVASSDVGAIRADGRYTHLYTPDGVRFCPWSIAEAEKRLVSEPFFRSHRSYIVNLQKVATFEKNREAGQCNFYGFPQLTSVPVSRARVGELLQQLGL